MCTEVISVNNTDHALIMLVWVYLYLVQIQTEVANTFFLFNTHLPVLRKWYRLLIFWIAQYLYLFFCLWLMIENNENCYYIFILSNIKILVLGEQYLRTYDILTFWRWQSACCSHKAVSYWYSNDSFCFGKNYVSLKKCFKTVHKYRIIPTFYFE